ncbi:hypothetical protein [Nosocomiicoccus massiliensis]|uniref:Type II toxin-antitoxin system PemK/MazF family toxin n=1 Tax=Nosocomiicoccus massiliensis TaxID=1232430 RepID=A0AAF1BNZ3_9STAP|nr:hypothetical protein [Nosocomiicoccus massiliensis]WOS96680.1 hypothetical protein CJ229_002750 [Nosocomiicoccus massiliensis]
MNMKMQKGIVLDYRKSTKDYINCITLSRYPYFDVKSQKKSFKVRPVLIIGFEKDSFPCDINVLPVSSIQSSKHRHNEYDKQIPVDILNQLGTVLNKTSYIRVHKQSVVSSNDIVNNIGPINLKDISQKFYDEIIEAHKKFYDELFE